MSQKTILRTLSDGHAPRRGAFLSFLFLVFCFHKMVEAAVLKGGRPLTVPKQNKVPKQKVPKQNVPKSNVSKQNVTCRSRVICKKVASRSGTSGAQNKIEVATPAQKRREAPFFAPGAASIFALCPDCAAP